MRRLRTQFVGGGHDTLSSHLRVHDKAAKWGDGTFGTHKGMSGSVQTKLG